MSLVEEQILGGSDQAMRSAPSMLRFDRTDP
ncbi:hypothetical protein ACVIG9_000001, partial [Bradyrhizobium ottawaense]